MKSKIANAASLPAEYKAEHPGYAYSRRVFVPRCEGAKTTVSVYEIEPLQSAYPYHYHLQKEETFYIISGEGLLRTPEGQTPVSAGDLLFFPANEHGAHKLTNTSATEKLVYLDMDVISDLDVAVYPDSDKIGIWGKGVNRLYPRQANVDYYEGE